MANAAGIVLLDGRVLTARHDFREAQAVAVRGNRIQAVGSNEEIRQLIDSDTKVIHLQGRTVIPGIVESHNHMHYGVTRDVVDCSAARAPSIADIQRLIAEKASEKAPGEWIVARGYDHTKLAEGRHPTRWDLDEAAPNNPVFLSRTDSHIAVVNSAAMRVVGLEDEAPDPPGGSMDRADGRLTGVMREMAQHPFKKVATQYSREQWRKGHALTAHYYHQYGITSSHEMSGNDKDMIASMIEAHRSGELALRINFMVRVRGENQMGMHALEAGLISGLGDEWLRIGAFKFTLDGSLGGATAAMHEPYLNGEGRGITYVDQDQLDALVWKAHSAGFQLALHAIGDRAIDMVLDSVEKALKKAPRDNHRHRIEHCGLMSPQRLERMAALGMMAMPQPPFLYYLGDSYIKNIGMDRLRYAYPFRSYIDYGIPAAYSSDFSVVNIDPLAGMYSATTRTTEQGTTIWDEECVSLHEAVRAYTYYGAYASFEENIKGTVEVGKLADLAVLSKDIMAIPSEELLSTKVDYTILDGKIVYAPEERVDAP